MRQTQYFQQSFIRGMLEGTAQHQIAPEGASSVLYLENYNPNIEVHALIKRRAIDTYLHGFGNGAYAKYFKTNEFLGGSLTTLDAPYQQAPYFAFDILPVSNPRSEKAFVVFGARRTSSGVVVPYSLTETLEATYIAHTAPEYENVAGTRQISTKHYQEAIADAGLHNDADRDYAGHYVLGTYFAHWKYGESILFVTLPLDVDNNKYTIHAPSSADRRYFSPVYKWYRWDVTKKREDGKKWWNGLTALDNIATEKEKFTRWKVKSPTSLALDNMVDIGTVRNGVLDSNDPGIELLIAENDLAIEDAKTGYPAAMRRVPKTMMFASLGGAVYSYDDLEDNTVVWNIESNWLRTLHLPKIDSYEEAILAVRSDASAAEYDNLPLYETGNVSLHVSTIINGDAIPGKKIATGKVAVVPGRFTTTFQVGTNQIKRQYNYMTSDGIAPPGFLSFAYYDQAPANNSGFGDRGTLGFLVTVLPNYNEIGLPRPFMKGERIPIIVTATVDGNEVVIYKDVYEVADDLEPGYEKVIDNMHSSSKFLLDDNGGSAMERRTPVDSFVTDFAINDKIEQKNKYAAIWGTHGASPVLNFNPTTNKYTIGKVLSFTIRIKHETLKALLDQEISSINLYVSRPSTINGLLDSIGVLAPQEAPIGLYATPATDDIIDEDNTSFEGYGLVKRFLIEGDNAKPNYDLHRGEPFNTNSWLADSTHVWAVPVDDDGDPQTTAPQLGEVLPATKPTYRPDFILWDYPTNSPPLSLQYSGRKWEGVGAKFVVNIKSMVFIGGCVDKDGLEEQAIIRYCAFQNGVPLYDLFPLEHFIKIGSLPHVAVVEFREQLVWFNRQAHYRMVMPEIFNPATWEFLEAVDSGGTFGQKTVCNTPYGLCYANEMGVWITEGTVPMCLTFNAQTGANITSLYQAISTDSEYAYAYLHDVGRVQISENGYNQFLELLYDDKTNELILTTPITRFFSPLVLDGLTGTLGNWTGFTHELRLIYSFTHQNWRTETLFLRGKTNDNDLIKTVRCYTPWTGKMHAWSGQLIGLYDYPLPDSTLASTDSSVSHFVTTPSLEMPTDRLYILDPAGASTNVWTWDNFIVGYFVSHVLGDTISDAMLRAVYMGAIPRPIHATQLFRTIGNFNYSTTTADARFPFLSNADPQLSYALRSSNWANQLVGIGQPIDQFVDIVPLNWAAKANTAINPFNTAMETPGGITRQPIERVAGRESLALLTPLNTPFRRSVFMFASEMVVKVHNLLIEIASFKRRTI